VIKLLTQKLATKGLSLNREKTRFASRSGQQRVTGIVVNEKAIPPRKLRRRIRAMFHHANLFPKENIGKFNVLRGYLSYLNAFPDLKGTPELDGYRKVLSRLKSQAQSLVDKKS